MFLSKGKCLRKWFDKRSWKGNSFLNNALHFSNNITLIGMYASVLVKCFLLLTQSLKHDNYLNDRRCVFSTSLVIAVFYTKC